MGAVLLVFRAQFRRRWRSWLILVLLIGVVGGVVLAATAAGRRTATAYPRFIAAHGYDVYIFNDGPAPELARLPAVRSVTAVRLPGTGQPTCACTHAINPSNFYVNELAPARLSRLVKLVGGSMPSPTSRDDVVASFTLQQDYGIHVGSVFHVPLYAASQRQAVMGGANVAPTGPTVALHVVGIVAAELEFPSGQAPEYDLFTSPAFARAVNPRTLLASVYLVRLRHGSADLPQFVAESNHLHLLYVSNQDATAEAVAGSIHPQAVGWWVLAVLAALAGLAVVGQAIGRQSVVESEEFPALVALGLSRRQLVVLGTARNLAIALVGAAGAVVIAFALSPLAPVGEARLAEPSTGLAFAPFILLPGALVTVVVVLVLGLWPAVRAARVQSGDDRTLEVRRVPLIDRLSALGAPPSVVIGVRHALERGRGGGTVPVGTALFGTVIAVMALCATAVFGASLSHLTSTPTLYGSNFQLTFANLGASGYPAKETAAVRRVPAVTGITVITGNEVSIDGVSVSALAAQAVRGPVLLSQITGHVPAGDGQIVLGTTTLRRVGGRVGSIVHVTLQRPVGGPRTAAFRVVGTASFPSDAGLGGLGTGAAFTLHGYLDAVCAPGPTRNACQRAYEANANFFVLIRTAPGPAGHAATTHILTTSGSSAQRPAVPISLVNFGEAVNFPLILGFLLALFGAATLLHLLVVSVVRRRREIGLLKALGFRRSQVRATVCWQATTVALVGIVVGIPLGVAVGKAVWRAFATNLGAVPVSIVPVGLIAALGVGVLVVAVLLAAAPALAASRASTSQLLRDL